VVEGARLESVYRLIPYPGFESPSLRQAQEKWPPLRVAIFFVLDGETGIRRRSAYSREAIRIAHLPPRERWRADRRSAQRTRIPTGTIHTENSKSALVTAMPSQPVWPGASAHSPLNDSLNCALACRRNSYQSILAYLIGLDSTETNTSALSH
jgi:hypothetical protein